MKNESRVAGQMLSMLDEDEARSAKLADARFNRQMLADVRKGRVTNPRCVEARRDGCCYIYFIAGGGTPIKIGLSNAPYERLATLQTAHWTKLSIVAMVEGGLPVERAYHVRFAEYRLQGEWFRRCLEIEAEIARLNAVEHAAYRPGARREVLA